VRMSHVIVTSITVGQGGDKGDLACEAVPDIGGGVRSVGPKNILDPQTFSVLHG
jgi:hypothetical protein